MKVRFLRNTTFEGKTYAQGSEHELAKDVVNALGSSVEVLEEQKQKTKNVKSAPRDKMVKGSNTKEVKSSN